MAFMGSYSAPNPRTGGTGGSLPGLPPTNYNAAYGGIPQVPSPVGTAGTAIGGNIGNLGSLYQLGGGVNTFQQGQLQGALGSAIPNYAGLNAQSSSNIASELSGQVPQDVINTILTGAAERGIMTGSPMSPNSNAAYLRALGLTSLGMQQTGQQNMTAAMQRTPIAQPFNIASMFVSPEQQQQAESAAALYRSAPVPSAAANNAMDVARGGSFGGMGGPGWSSGYSGGAAEPNNWWNQPSPWETGYGEYVGDPSSFMSRPDQTPTDPYADWNQWTGGAGTGAAQGKGTGYYYDPTIGGYVDYNSGQISDTEGGPAWAGYTAQDFNTPAMENPFE